MHDTAHTCRGERTAFGVQFSLSPVHAIFLAGLVIPGQKLALVYLIKARKKVKEPLSMA